MTEYSKVTVSKNARILENGKWYIVGNIAEDGRWIKLLANDFNNIIGKLKLSQKIYTQEEMEVVKKLMAIKVLVEEDVFECLAPKDITLELTTQCNLKCKHCSYGFGDNMHHEMPLKMIIQLAKYSQENKVERILLTGGEIFCRKDIGTVISSIRKNFEGSLELITNGTLINESLLDIILDNVNKVHISLDGYDEQSVSEIRGKNVFSKVIKFINRLNEKGVTDITLSCVDVGDCQRIVRFKKLAEDLGVKTLIRQLNLKGRAKDNFVYENTEYLNGITVTPNSTTMKCLCNHRYVSLFVDTKGDVFPCAALREGGYSIGKFLSENRRISLKRSIQIPVVDQIEECKNCNVRYFCASNCISQNYIIFYQESERKKRCQYRRRSLEDGVWGTINNDIET